MWLEQRKLLFAPLIVQSSGSQYKVMLGSHKLPLSPIRYSYLKFLQQGKSPTELVMHFLKAGQLISFRELIGLIHDLVEMQMILNPEWHQYLALSKGQSVTENPLSAQIQREIGEKADPNVLKSLPFFRRLSKEIQDLFIRNTTVQRIKLGQKLCSTGDTTREMYALLEGNLGVFRTLDGNRQQLLSTVSVGALVGEGGFLLGRPRAADVIAMSSAKVAVIHHVPEFDSVIATGKAEVLQRRFWVLNGLLTSPLFSKVPIETLDCLVFAGQLKEIQSQTEIIKEGDKGRSFFIVVQGAINIHRQDKILRTLGQGGIFGEIALMVSGGTRTASATATKNSLLLEIEQTEFYEVLSTHLTLAKHLEEIAWQRANED